MRLFIFQKALVELDGDAWLGHVRHVDEDIISRVTVERSTEALLVEVVTNETDAASEHEETVQGTDLQENIRLIAMTSSETNYLDVLIGFLR